MRILLLFLRSMKQRNLLLPLHLHQLRLQKFLKREIRSTRVESKKLWNPVLCNLLWFQKQLKLKMSCHHNHRHQHRRFMIAVAFHMIQVKGCQFQVILLMIKMQLEGHIFLMVHTNLIHMNLRKEQLEVESGVSIVYGFTNMIGLNIVQKKGSCVLLLMLLVQGQTK